MLRREIAIMRAENPEPLAVTIEAVAQLVSANPDNVMNLVREGYLPCPFRMCPGGPLVWFVPEVRKRLEKRSRLANRSPKAA
jgi:hypothetical protein